MITITEYVSDTFGVHYASLPFEIIFDRYHYIEVPTTYFYLCSSLFEYFPTGYLDYILVKKYFDKYYPIPSEYEKAYINLLLYPTISEEKMKNSFATFRRGLNSQQYGIEELLKISSLVSKWKQNNYLELFKQEDLLTEIEKHFHKVDFTKYKYQTLLNMKKETEN